ncbi:MAG: TetR/AcrR family transcriptional regulator [Lentisphaeria bacterium]|nr:TetR/AcrR family transcriptional regulator [Lentisphaeria bacterium]
MAVKTREKRNQILKAGEELFASRRYDEITMDEIAQLAQVGKGTLYRYFSGKEALLYAILQSCHEDLVASIRAASMQKGSFQELLTGVCKQIAVSHERRHPMFHIAFALNRKGPDDTPEAKMRCEQMKSNYASLMDTIADVFRYGRREGVLRSEMSDEALAYCLLELMHGIGRSRSQAGQKVSLEEVVELFCHGVMKS